MHPNHSGRGRYIRMISVLACLLLSGAQSYPQPVRTQHLTVELITETRTIAPNHDFLAGLHFVLDRGWHIYWINAGDAGEPPRVEWQLPAGIVAGNLQFPAPQRLPLGPLMDFGYENEVLLRIPMLTDGSLQSGSNKTLRGHLHFLVCSNVCIPGRADLEHIVPVTAQTGVPDPKTEPLFLTTDHNLPRNLPPGASLSVTQTGTAVALMLTTGKRIASAEFYPFDQNIIANAAAEKIEPLMNGVRITLQKAQGSQMPGHLHGLIELPDGTAYEFISALASAPIASLTNGTSLSRVLGLAFLGGLILNLMPCVFPVLFIKGLSLVQSSGEERKRLRFHGAMYTFGILVSFWIIVAVLLLLRAGGSHLGWGFQFQSPYFVAVMALLFFFLGLSLAGQFEIGLSATSVGGGLAGRGGYTGSFFTGVLASVVATPCTAPFMGAAIGFALSQSIAITFSVFTLLALGLAAPYVVLTIQPAWTRLLPRPGVWMEYLKQAVSIPIFLAVIWMVWVFGHVVGGDGVAALLAGMLVTAIAGWVLGHWPAKWASTVVAVLLLIIAVALPGVAASQLRASATTNHEEAGDNFAWQPFSPQKLTVYRAQGKPIFVDFSATWCLSCQVNERIILDRSEVEEAFRNHGVVMMRADWTNHDDSITEALRQLGRSGVPTYALYSGGADTGPTVLPEVLTQGIVFDALNRLTTHSAESRGISVSP
jgi:thiol:disulfide interchange protein